MDISSLLSAFKLHARIDGDSEDAGLLLMLDAAANDIAHAAGYPLPPDAAELPEDLAFAVIDQATAIYDDRGTGDAPHGLTVAASRIVSRYRGVSLGVTDA
jgi:hypothetical protein